MLVEEAMLPFRGAGDGGISTFFGAGVAETNKVKILNTSGMKEKKSQLKVRGTHMTVKQQKHLCTHTHAVCIQKLCRHTGFCAERVPRLK